MGKALTSLLKTGIEDELRSALTYIEIAGVSEDLTLQSSFINYASEELFHAHKLMQLAYDRGEPLGKLDLVRAPYDGDLASLLVEYIAREEASVFYYQSLCALHPDPDIQQVCQSIGADEQDHMNLITDLLASLHEKKKEVES